MGRSDGPTAPPARRSRPASHGGLLLARRTSSRRCRSGAGGSGVVRLWNAETGSPIWSVDDHAEEALAIVFAPDGFSLATAGADRPIKLRDPRSGSVLRTLDAQKVGVTSLAFSGDGAILCGGRTDEATDLWETRTGRSLRTIRPAKSPRGSMQGRLITSVARSADGGILVTCSGSESSEFGDRLVRVWKRAHRRASARILSPTKFRPVRHPCGRRHHAGNERVGQGNRTLGREDGTTDPGARGTRPSGAGRGVLRGRPAPGQRRRLPDDEGLGRFDRTTACHARHIFRERLRQGRG